MWQPRSLAMALVRRPSHLRTIIFACTTQSAGAWALRARVRTWRASPSSSGARAYSHVGMEHLLALVSASSVPRLRNGALGEQDREERGTSWEDVTLGHGWFLRL